jgi:hypothetical protein
MFTYTFQRGVQIKTNAKIMQTLNYLDDNAMELKKFFLRDLRYVIIGNTIFSLLIIGLAVLILSEKKDTTFKLDDIVKVKLLPLNPENNKCFYYEDQEIGYMTEEQKRWCKEILSSKENATFYATTKDAKKVLILTDNIPKKELHNPNNLKLNQLTLTPEEKTQVIKNASINKRQEIKDYLYIEGPVDGKNIEKEIDIELINSESNEYLFNLDKFKELMKVNNNDSSIIKINLKSVDKTGVFTEYYQTKSIFEENAKKYGLVLLLLIISVGLLYQSIIPYLKLKKQLKDDLSILEYRDRLIKLNSL